MEMILKIEDDRVVRLLVLMIQTGVLITGCPPTDLYQSLTKHFQRLWQVE